ncbi:MAG: MBL fold metallo-hydrolase [Gemmatimonadota bacterium]|nr:MAG: MBL fold metallo-hydrolase [Gemmatimonadota bacterium]
MEPRYINAGNRGPFTLDGTRTYFVGSDVVAIIDPGPDVEDHVRAVVREANGARRVVVLLTHGHPDHSGAAEAVASALGAPVLGVRHGAGTVLTDGEAVETDHGALVAIETPGHSKPHLSFHWPDAGAVFPGDLILGEGDTTWVGEYPGCVADYLASLARLRDLAPRVMYPAHGPSIEDVPGTLDAYEAHRHDRISQVEGIVSSRPGATPAEILGLVYGDTLEDGLRGAALKSVEALMHHVSQN